MLTIAYEIQYMDNPVHGTLLYFTLYQGDQYP